LKKSNKVLFYGGASGAIISIPWAATLFNPTSMFPVTLTCVVVSAGSVEWEKWNFDKEITKKQYDSLIKVDGNLRAFWAVAK